jgi:integrase/recombinase XerD
VRGTLLLLGKEVKWMEEHLSWDLVNQFSTWLHEEGRSLKTIESYVGDVKGFQTFLAERTTGETEDQPITRYSIVRFKQYLVENKFAISTINKKINSLKVYNDFLRIKGIVDETYVFPKKDRVKVAMGSESEVQVLTEEQTEKLLFYVENRQKVSLRNRLIIYLLLYTGVRVSELVSICMKDIDYLTNTLSVCGKGGKIREIGLRQDVIESIKSYMKEERSKSSFRDSPYLLLSQRSEKLHRDAVNNWLTKVSKELGFHMHPHLFRHTFATRLIHKGVEITTVSKICGHHSVSLTANIYVHSSLSQKIEAVELL